MRVYGVEVDAAFYLALAYVYTMYIQWKIDAGIWHLIRIGQAHPLTHFFWHTDVYMVRFWCVYAVVLQLSNS